MDIASLARHRYRTYPDHTALVCGDGRLTYAQWASGWSDSRTRWSTSGVRPTDRIAFYVRTSEASVTAYFACQLLGAIAVPMNYPAVPQRSRIHPPDVCPVPVSWSMAVTLAANPLGREGAGRARSATAYRARHDPSTTSPAVHHHFDTLIDRPRPRRRCLPLTPDEISALVYTSGTTGRPKGVIHRHGNDVAIAMNCVMEYRLTHRISALHIAPLYHVGGMQAYFMPHLMVGAPTSCCRGTTRADACERSGKNASRRCLPCRPRSRTCCSTPRSIGVP